MSESLWVSLLQFLVSPVIVLILGAVLNRKIKETKQEITNSHPIHLRDDLDGKFSLVFARQDTVLEELKRVDKKLDVQRADVAQLFETAADHERRLTGQAAKIRRTVGSKK